MNKQQIIGTMVQGAFFSVNKKLAKHLGSNDAALILSHLIYLQEQFFQGGEFYQQQERIMDECNVTVTVLRTAVKLLKDNGVLSVIKKGIPAKNYYLVSLNAIAEILGATDTPLQSQQIPSTGGKESLPPVGTIRSTSTKNTSSQRVNKNKLNNTNKLEIEYKIIKLKEAGRYSDTIKIPASFNSRDEYVDYLYTQ
jgi:hypothetical protein